MVQRGHSPTLSNVDVIQVIFDVLLRKGDLVEKFVAFANKPRLLQRFRERLADYKRFWEGVQVRLGSVAPRAARLLVARREEGRRGAEYCAVETKR